MSRFLASLLLLALAMTGCQPRNPLEWKIRAPSPGDLDAWQGRYLNRLPVALRGELVHGLIVLSSSAGVGARARSQTDLGNRLCRRIDGKTVRTILIDAYYTERGFLLTRRILNSDNIVRSSKNSDALMDRPEQFEQFENAQVRQEFNLELMKERLAEIEERLKVLEGPAR